MSGMRLWIPALLSGLLFGAGLVISDMTSAPRVLAFLTLNAGWDATLGWVMASALAVAVPGFALARQRGRPLFAERYSAPTSSPIDRRLLLGALLFGLGWGLAGYCPGPALVGAALGVGNALWLVLAMLVGAAAAKFINTRSSGA